MNIDPTQIADSQPEPWVEAARREAASLLLDASAHLSPKLQRIMQLRFGVPAGSGRYACTVAETARVLGVPRTRVICNECMLLTQLSVLLHGLRESL